MNEAMSDNPLDGLMIEDNYVRVLRYYGVKIDIEGFRCGRQEIVVCPICKQDKSLRIVPNRDTTGGNYYCSACKKCGTMANLISDKEGYDLHDRQNIANKIQMIIGLNEEQMPAIIIPKENACPLENTGNEKESIKTNEKSETATQPLGIKTKRLWPILDEEAYLGVFGKYVNAVADYTEADPVGILVQLLNCFSNVVGSGPYYKHAATIHKLNIYTVIVGRSSRSRKGTGWDIVLSIMKMVAPLWYENNLKSGLSSGEGLIYEVRDPIQEENDPGVQDKRREIYETEFGRVLKVKERPTNPLGEIIRQAWDHGNLNVLTRTSPLRATNSYISINGHITNAELNVLIDRTDIFNGFANRFLWVCVKRANIRPSGDDFDKIDPSSYVEQINRAIEFSKTVERIQFDQEAKELWGHIYKSLAVEQLEQTINIFDEITARAEAQIVRLACIYALSDSSDTIKPPHLKAALALWKYTEDSIRYIFGDALSNSIAEKIREALKTSPDGLTRSEISNVFGRNQDKRAIDGALEILLKANLATCRKIFTNGRPEERWFYAGK